MVFDENTSTLNHGFDGIRLPTPLAKKFIY